MGSSRWRDRRSTVVPPHPPKSLSSRAPGHGSYHMPGHILHQPGMSGDELSWVTISPRCLLLCGAYAVTAPSLSHLAPCEPDEILVPRRPSAEHRHHDRWRPAASNSRLRSSLSRALAPPAHTHLVHTDVPSRRPLPARFTPGALCERCCVCRPLASCLCIPALRAPGLSPTFACPVEQDGALGSVRSALRA